MWGERPRIGQQPQASTTRLKHKLCRLTGIVRNRVRLDIQVANLESGVALYQAQVAVAKHPLESAQGPGGRPHGNLVLKGQARNTSNVVSMFVGNEL